MNKTSHSNFIVPLLYTSILSGGFRDGLPNDAPSLKKDPSSLTRRGLTLSSLDFRLNNRRSSESF